MDNKIKRTLRYHGWAQQWLQSKDRRKPRTYFFLGCGPGEELWGSNIGVWFHYKVLGQPRPHPTFFGSPSVSLPWFPLRRTARLSLPQSSNSCVSMDLMGWTLIGSTLALVEALFRTSTSSLSWCRWEGRWQSLAQGNSKTLLSKENLVAPDWN